MWPFKSPPPTYDQVETNIGNVLKDMGLISGKQLHTAALAHYARADRIGDTLVEMGFVTREHLHRALAIQKDLRTAGREVLGQMAIMQEHVRERKITQTALQEVILGHSHL